MSKFLWCEDSKSGYQFWRMIFGTLYPDITVETKESNSRLRKAASKIQADGNEYYILMDVAMDNPDVIRETKKLKEDAAGKDNIHLIKLHSFEYALLSFELLEQWVFADVHPLKDDRQDLLHARALFIDRMSSQGDTADLAAFKAAFDQYEKKNSEQIAASLLRDITRNTGFQTDKTGLGECFINDCCTWKLRKNDDLCGLDSHRITADEKAKLLVDRSALKAAFEGVGL